LPASSFEGGINLERNQLIAIGVIVIVVAGAGLALFFFSGPQRPPEDTLIWETISNPDYLDPHIDYESFGSWISYNVYETLYTYPFGSSSTVPSTPLLAASAPVWSADGLSVNVSLREDITFHDGTPLNASVVKWNAERAMKIFYPDGPVWMFAEPILGGAVLEGIAFDEGPSSPEFAAAFDAWVLTDAIVVVDEYTIQFNLEDPYIPFIDAITYAVGAQMSPTFALANAGNDTLPAGGDWTEHYGVDYGEYLGFMSEHTCGTGPYMVSEWRQNQYVFMELYEDYWRADDTRTDLTSPVDVRPPNYAGSLKSAYIKTVDDVTTRLLNIRAGTSDGMYLPQTQALELWEWTDITALEGNPIYDDVTVTTGGASYFVEHFGFNMGTVYDANGNTGLNLTSPFIDINLRRAFAYAFNTTAFLLTAVNGFGVQAQGIIPIGMFGHVDDLPMYLQNMTAAQEYWNLAMANPTTLANYEAFEANGGLTLYHNTGNLRREAACLVLKDSISQLYAMAGTTQIDTDATDALTINIQPLEWSNYLEQNRRRRMPLFIIGWIPDYADPDNYVFPYAYHYGTFSFRLGYNNTDVNDWYDQTRGEQNVTRRAELFELIEYAVYEDLPYLMVLQGAELRAYRTWLKGNGLVWNPMTTASIGVGYMFHVYKDYPA
jgi:peptide/nickel transport system substrate-binding protein